MSWYSSFCFKRSIHLNRVTEQEQHEDMSDFQIECKQVHLTSCEAETSRSQNQIEGHTTLTQHSAFTQNPHDVHSAFTHRWGWSCFQGFSTFTQVTSFWVLLLDKLQTFICCCSLSLELFFIDLTIYRRAAETIDQWFDDLCFSLKNICCFSFYVWGTILKTKQQQHFKTSSTETRNKPNDIYQ